MEKGRAGDIGGVAVAGGNGYLELAPGPYMAAAAECWRRGDDGQPYLVWQDGFSHNAVMSGGLVHLVNRFFGSVTNSTAACGLFLHSATVGSNNGWANISTGVVSGHSANMPIVTFASNGTAMSQSASFGFTFSHAGTQTVSGCGLVFGTTNTIATNVAAASVVLYNYGTFSNGSRAVQSNDTLNVSQTITYVTA